MLNFRGSLISPLLFQRKFFTRKLQFSRARASMDNMLPNPQGALSKEIPSKLVSRASCIFLYFRWEGQLFFFISGGRKIRLARLRSRHCFADSCNLERGQRCDSAYQIELACMPRPYYITCAVCAWFRQRIHISTKSAKTTIRENLDPRKFSAIR